MRAAIKRRRVKVCGVIEAFSVSIANLQTDTKHVGAVWSYLLQLIQLAVLERQFGALSFVLHRLSLSKSLLWHLSLRGHLRRSVSSLVLIAEDLCCVLHTCLMDLRQSWRGGGWRFAPWLKSVKSPSLLSAMSPGSLWAFIFKVHKALFEYRWHN